MKNLRLLWVLTWLSIAIGFALPQSVGAQSGLLRSGAQAKALADGLSRVSTALKPLGAVSGPQAFAYLSRQPELWVDPHFRTVIDAVRRGDLDPSSPGLAGVHPALTPLLRHIAVVSANEVPLYGTPFAHVATTEPRLTAGCQVTSPIAAVCAPLSTFDLLGAPRQKISPAQLPARRGEAIAALGGALNLGAVGVDIEPGATVSAEQFVAELGRMNVDRLHRAGITPVAVSDWDRTLSKGSAPRAFLEFMVARQGFLPAANDAVVDHLVGLDLGFTEAELLDNTIQQNMVLVADLEEQGRIHWLDRLEITGKAFKGMTPTQAERLAREFYYVGIPGTIEPYIRNLFPGSRDVVAAIQPHVDFWIVTAGYDFLGRAGGEALGVPGNRVIGTELEVVDGVYSGRLQTVVSRYGKENLVRERIGETPLMGFGDNPADDTEMMKDALFGFMINPPEAFIERNGAERLGFQTLRYPQNATDGFEPY